MTCHTDNIQYPYWPDIVPYIGADCDGRLAKASGGVILICLSLPEWRCLRSLVRDILLVSLWGSRSFIIVKPKGFVTGGTTPFNLLSSLYRLPRLSKLKGNGSSGVNIRTYVKVSVLWRQPKRLEIRDQMWIYLFSLKSVLVSTGSNNLLQDSDSLDGMPGVKFLRFCSPSGIELNFENPTE